jgi:hypothetical protein
VLNITQSGDIKAQLLSRLQALTGRSINTIDAEIVEPDLLAEIAESKVDDPTPAPPPEMAVPELPGSRHTIPHKQSINTNKQSIDEAMQPESDDLLQCNKDDDLLQCNRNE